jgi:ribosomal 30S subunit maturation factor RimM
MSEPNDTSTTSSDQPASDTREADKSSTKCLAAKNKGVIVYCEHDHKLRKFDHPSGELDVVQTKDYDEVTIFSKDDDAPGQLDVYRDGEKIDSISGTSKSGGKEYKLKATYCPGGDPYADGETIFHKILTYKCDPTIYTIQGLRAPVTVKAFNPDQWLFSVSLPPFRKTKMGRVLDNRTTATVDIQGKTAVVTQPIKKTFTVTESQNWQTKSSSEGVQSSYNEYIAKYNVKKKMWKLADASQVTEIESKSKNEKLEVGSEILESIKFQRNGTSFRCDSLTLVMAALGYAKSIYDMLKNFDDLVPKIGWYMNLELQILVGSYQIGWGWREVPTKWQTFYYFGAGMKMTIIDIAFEAGWGIDVGSAFKAQVCFGVKGSIEATLFQFETTGPAKADLNIGKLEGSMTGGLYARVTVGFFVNAEGAAETGIKGEVKLVLDSEFTLKFEGSGNWTGVTAKYTQSVGWFGSETTTKSQVLVKPSPMKKFEFPKEPEEVQQFSEYEVADKINATLQPEGWWGAIKVKELNEYDGFYYDCDMGKIAEMIAQKIMLQKQTLLLDDKTVEGLSHAVRKKCEVLGYRGIWPDFVDYDNLADYLNGAEFAQVLADAEDPVKQRLAH